MNCFECDEFVPIGEGDHICLRSDPPLLVTDGYEPTNDFMWCQNEKPAGNAVTDEPTDRS